MSAQRFERSEDPNHPDNGPSDGDLLEMGYCPMCRRPAEFCACDDEYEAYRDEMRRRESDG